MTIAGARVYARMAADGMLPRMLATHAGAPHRAIALQCALALVLLWSASFKSLLTYIGFTLNLCAAATIVGLIRLKLNEGVRLRVIGWPVAPLLFLGGVSWMTASAVALQPIESLWGMATLALAWVVWWWSRTGNRR